MRRNPPSYRLFERSAALEKVLELMQSPIADIVSVIQVAGVTSEANSVVLSDAKCGLSTAQTLHSTLRRVKPERVGGKRTQLSFSRPER